MSIRLGSQPQFPVRKLSGADTGSAEWTRPADWPALTPTIPGEQKVIGLYAVYNTTTEKVAFTCAGAYSVDWGDGTAVENVATGVKAEHAYTYATLATPLTSRGYKTAIITITPQSAQNLTSVDLTSTYSGATTGAKSSQWLDLELRVPNCTTLVISSSTTRKALLEKVAVLQHNRTNWTEMFRNCYSLQSVQIENGSIITIATAMFMGCYALRSFPQFDMSNITDISNIIRLCSSMTEIVLLNIPKVTNVSSAIQENVSLRKAVLQTTPLTTNFTGLAFSNSNLREIEIANTSSATTMNDMFNAGLSLQVIPAINMSAVTSQAAGFASGCNALGRSLAFGMRYTHSYANGELSAAALNEIFTNLGTAAGSQTITITGNPGAATCDQSIATAKSWTVAN
jgi:hypothetical protein